MRDIKDILLFREDISPFLVHLTRDLPNTTAADALRSIIQTREIRCGTGQVSDARFAVHTAEFGDEKKRRFFGAACFTETPLAETHCLLEIAYRNVELQPYGLVFLKERMLSRAGLSPVIYLNNTSGDQGEAIRAICSLIDDSPDEAARLVPLISIFGQKLTPPSAAPQQGHVDFRWEREWRVPSEFSPVCFTQDDIFVGICPHEEKQQFEQILPNIKFIDPRRNMKWYATELIQARQRCDLKTSVV